MWQHCWRNMLRAFGHRVGRNMLRAFGHRVAMCCDMLGVVGSNLKMVKFEPTTPNMSQHGGTQHVATCCVGMLRSFGRGLRATAAPCVSLKHLSKLSIKPRPNDRNMPTQHVATLLGATCCVRFATVLRCHVGCCWLKFDQFQI